MRRGPLRTRFARLRGDRRGAALTEFAIVAPVMVMMMMGLGDLLYQAYAQALLNGAIQKAGRDSTIQGAANETDTIDAKVAATVKQIAKDATFTITRKNYDNFTNVAPEPFTDSNKNGVRDAKECFTDINRNNQWDADPGTDGQGGANDVTAYSISVVYPRLFPTAKLLGWGSTATIKAQTLLKNQPYETQTTLAPATICT